LEAYKLDKEVLNTKGEEVHFFCANNVKYKLSNSQKIYAVFKRLFDILFSFLAILFLSPLFILLAFAVKLTSKGSVIFRQERIGQFGKTIKIYKFRTMTSKAPKSKATKDFDDAKEYITKLGKFLRVTSLDEMPQLLNVLKGDMSIIGPRPLILDEVFIHKLREKNDVYLIKPGITGLAQVNGRDFLDAQDKVNFDTKYLHNMSLKLDLMVFIKSIIVVFRQENSLDANR
jgi:O-antigen biosynthesis protein WbqP